MQAHQDKVRGWGIIKQARLPSPTSSPTLSFNTSCLDGMETWTVCSMKVLVALCLCQGGHILVGLAFSASLRLSSCPPRYTSVSQGACKHLSSDSTSLVPTKPRAPQDSTMMDPGGLLWQPQSDPTFLLAFRLTQSALHITDLNSSDLNLTLHFQAHL